MSVYLCRWPNGDVSLACGNNRLEIEHVLDEVGDPGGAELIRIKHPVAVHFHLKEKIEPSDFVPSCLEFEGIDERLCSEVCEAYPILDEVLMRENATSEEIAAAVEQEKDRVEKIPELSKDPNVANLQLMMSLSKRLAEHYAEIASKEA